MIEDRKRFTPLQRLLHWLMAICILAMLFIGVGMVSTVNPKYLTLVAIHKPLGVAILVLALIRLAVRLRYGTPPLPADLPEPMRVAAKLSHYAFYVPHDRHAVARLGDAVGGRLPGRAVRERAPSSHPTAERQPACAALGRAFLACFCVLCPGPVARRGGTFPCARPTRWRIRSDGVPVDPRRSRARRVTPKRASVAASVQLSRAPRLYVAVFSA